MKEMVSTSLVDVSQPQRHVAWYRAMTLTERAALLKEHFSAQSSLSPADDEGAQQRLQRWREQIPFNKVGYFGQRLAQDGLTEDDLLGLLAESPEALQARVS